MEWMLEPGRLCLNHGSFGACLREVYELQQQIRLRLESGPNRFFLSELLPLTDKARRSLATFVGSADDDLVFVPNATHGVGSVLRSLRFEPGDELLVSDHAYAACRNALDFVAQRSGARVVLAEIPFPCAGPGQVIDAVLSRVSARTRLALLDHVTSPTALILPIAELTTALRVRGVLSLVDGAHAPGMLPLDLASLGADYYTGNCHKWLSCPRGVGFLWVRPELQAGIRPLAISHGARAAHAGSSRFLLEFAWTGTDDPSGRLVVSSALKLLGQALPGGWPALMQRNRALALEARELLCGRLGVAPPSPASMLGSMVLLPLPDGPGPGRGLLARSPLEIALDSRYGIEVPIISWPAPPRRWLRVSAHLYNQSSDYLKLADALQELLAEETH